jgi:glutaredoxin
MQAGSRKRPCMYGLSTCGWCAKARAWLDNGVAEYDLIYVDLLDPEEQAKVKSELRTAADPLGFPVVFFGDQCVVGYKPDEYERLVEK